MDMRGIGEDQLYLGEILEDLLSTVGDMKRLVC
jgi:hypothetical protein